MVIAASLLVHPSARYFPCFFFFFFFFFFSSFTSLSLPLCDGFTPFFSLCRRSSVPLSFWCAPNRCRIRFVRKNIKNLNGMRSRKNHLPFSNMMFIESNSNYLLLFVLTQQVFLRCTQIRPATTDWRLFATRVASTRERTARWIQMIIFFLNNFFFV